MKKKITLMTSAVLVLYLSSVVHAEPEEVPTASLNNSKSTKTIYDIGDSRAEVKTYFSDSIPTAAGTQVLPLVMQAFKDSPYISSMRASKVGVKKNYNSWGRWDFDTTYLLQVSVNSNIPLTLFFEAVATNYACGEAAGSAKSSNLSPYSDFDDPHAAGFFSTDFSFYNQASYSPASPGGRGGPAGRAATSTSSGSCNLPAPSLRVEGPIYVQSVALDGLTQLANSFVNTMTVDFKVDRSTSIKDEDKGFEKYIESKFIIADRHFEKRLADLSKAIGVVLTPQQPGASHRSMQANGLYRDQVLKYSSRFLRGVNKKMIRGLDAQLPTEVTE